MSGPDAKLFERRVITAAVKLCDAGGGFCFKDDLKISDQRIGRRLEYAVAALKDARSKRGKK